jgi:hypothetical protein
MYWIQTIVILLLLNTVENFNLIQNKIRSRLQNPSYELKSNTSTARVSRTCLGNCESIFTFNESLVRPEACNQIETDYACEMIITIDYEYQEIGFLPFNIGESLTIDSITYDSVAEHFAYLLYSENSAYHILYYACLTGNYCEWEYAQQIIPQLLAINYTSLYNLLLPKVSNSNGRPNITQCYSDNELVNCSSGSCEFLQSTDDDYNLFISRDCNIFRESLVEIGQVRYTPGPAKHDYDTLDFRCNINECNGETNEYGIKEIISSNWIQSISSDSLGTKFRLINFNLYFLGFVLIQYLK